jgi:hypothetical protein
MLMFFDCWDRSCVFSPKDPSPQIFADLGAWRIDKCHLPSWALGRLARSGHAHRDWYSEVIDFLLAKPGAQTTPRQLFCAQAACNSVLSRRQFVV